ncbi:helix-turn-helix domain-containing protein, partial [Streptococcus pyogenes]
MNENYKTIKELADELGVSKSYVDKIIRILKLH